MLEIEIEHDGPTPPYMQLARILRGHIEAGRIPPGERIPSQSEIQGMTALARGTIRRAVAVLVAQGLVEVVPQRGVYVIEQADNR